jgi:hypothetical protein
MTDFFDDVEIISSYSLNQAIEDGILFKLCDIRFGIVIKPLITTTNLLREIGREKS